MVVYCCFNTDAGAYIYVYRQTSYQTAADKKVAEEAALDIPVADPGDAAYRIPAQNGTRSKFD